MIDAAEMVAAYNAAAVPEPDITGDTEKQREGEETRLMEKMDWRKSVCIGRTRQVKAGAGGPLCQAKPTHGSQPTSGCISVYSPYSVSVQ